VQASGTRPVATSSAANSVVVLAGSVDGVTYSYVTGSVVVHVDDRSQVMYDSAGAVRDYQGGDLAGLAVLGRGPCESGP
jgi:hypothetical protein